MVDYIITVLEQTGLQLLFFFGPALFLAFIMQLLVSAVERSSYNLMGRRVYLFFFAWLGVSIHELGHALFCLIFRHKIIEIKLFSPDAETGTLGYVRHSYNPGSIYQRIGNFFIGIGPILLGSLVIFLSAKWLLLSSIEITTTSTQELGVVELLTSAFLGALDYFKSLFVFESLRRWQTYLFFYISFSVGSHITLSPADIKGAFVGFVSLVLLVLVVNLISIGFINLGGTLYLLLTPVYHLFYGIMIFVLFVNLLFRAILAIFD